MTVSYDPDNPTIYATHVIMNAARVDHWPWDPSEQARVLKLARRNTHPDAVGTRDHWDLVDWAANTLMLNPDRAAV